MTGRYCVIRADSHKKNLQNPAQKNPPKKLPPAMVATLARASTSTSRAYAGRLPDLQDLDERTVLMCLHNGVMLRALQGSPEERLRAAVACRRLIARRRNAPVQAVIDAGLVPLFVRFLDEPLLADSPVLDDTLWMLINVAAGEPEQTLAVARSGAVPPLVRLLVAATCYSHAHLAAWALANVAREPEITE